MERIPCSGDPTHILEMNGESYRLAQSKRRSRRAQSDASFGSTKRPTFPSRNTLARRYASNCAHRGSNDHSSVRALALKPRACGAPLCGFGA
jgi:hypothetical protein